VDDAIPQTYDYAFSGLSKALSIPQTLPDHSWRPFAVILNWPNDYAEQAISRAFGNKVKVALTFAGFRDFVNAYSEEVPGSHQKTLMIFDIQ